MKHVSIFYIVAQNIDCRYTLEPLIEAVTMITVREHLNYLVLHCRVILQNCILANIVNEFISTSNIVLLILHLLIVSIVSEMCTYNSVYCCHDQA